MPKHYEGMKHILGIHLKDNLVGRKHLIDYDYYDCIFFHQLLGRAKVYNTHNAVRWAII